MAPFGRRQFVTTRWSLVRAAARSRSPAQQQALAELCRIYWMPVYAFIRSRGNDDESAKDLTQGFFTQLLDKKFLSKIGPFRGRFRTFLLVCVKHFMANEWDRERALKRGGGEFHLPLGTIDPESCLRVEPADHRTPDRIFERQWAETTMQRVMEKLEAVMTERGQAARFRALRPYLSGESETPQYRSVAIDLGISEGAVRVAVHDLRRRFGKLLREEVADTVSGPAVVDEEIRFLLGALID
jgi:RNA polymerase sigma-70 factor (ECF subfamily)